MTKERDREWIVELVARGVGVWRHANHWRIFQRNGLEMGDRESDVLTLGAALNAMSAGTAAGSAADATITQESVAASIRRELLVWVDERIDAEVANRPDENKYKRTLDETWTQVRNRIELLPDQSSANNEIARLTAQVTALREERGELFQDTCDYLDEIGALKAQMAALRAVIEAEHAMACARVYEQPLADPRTGYWIGARDALASVLSGRPLTAGTSRGGATKETEG